MDERRNTYPHLPYPHHGEASKQSKYAPQPETPFIMVCFMGFQELSPSVVQNVLQEATSHMFSLFMTICTIIFQQWQCGSHRTNTNIGGAGEGKEDVYVRDCRILAVTTKDKGWMYKR
jgi:hypothetical protein